MSDDLPQASHNLLYAVANAVLNASEWAQRIHYSGEYGVAHQIALALLSARDAAADLDIDLDHAIDAVHSVRYFAEALLSNQFEQQSLRAKAHKETEALIRILRPLRTDVVQRMDRQGLKLFGGPGALMQAPAE